MAHPSPALRTCGRLRGNLRAAVLACSESHTPRLHPSPRGPLRGRSRAAVLAGAASDKWRLSDTGPRAARGARRIGVSVDRNDAAPCTPLGVWRPPVGSAPPPPPKARHLEPGCAAFPYTTTRPVLLTVCEQNGSAAGHPCSSIGACGSSNSTQTTKH